MGKRHNYVEYLVRPLGKPFLNEKNEFREMYAESIRTRRSNPRGMTWENITTMPSILSGRSANLFGTRKMNFRNCMPRPEIVHSANMSSTSRSRQPQTTMPRGPLLPGANILALSIGPFRRVCFVCRVPVTWLSLSLPCPTSCRGLFSAYIVVAEIPWFETRRKLKHSV